VTLEGHAALMRLKSDQDAKEMEARAKSIHREQEMIRSLK